jgi:outer membrane protein assembly factor BamB
LWSFTTGGIVKSSPAIGPDRTLYFGSSDGNIYAIGE